MKNLYIIFICLFINFYGYSQQYITWNPVNNGNQVTGFFNGGTVTITNTNNGVYTVNSPALQQQGNLVVNGANTFSTNRPASSTVLAPNLVLNFSIPVIVTRFNVEDVDRLTWDDSFNFLNINFTNNPAPNSFNCNVNLNGVQATQGADGAFANWFCSNGAINTFSINYQVINGLTCAYLGYSIEVLVPPSIGPVCLGDQPTFPVVGNNIAGTWNPGNIDTSSLGTTNYTFTPNVGQPIQCPIVMPVNVINCCIPTLTSNQAIANMVQVERGDWIRSTDVVTFSDGIVGNGVVYHALNFVELNPGFDAVYGSQFAAYPEDCSGNYVYREANPDKENLKEPVIVSNITSQRTSIFNVITEFSSSFIEIPLTDYELEVVNIYSLSGKLLYSGEMKKDKNTRIDVSSFDSGIYLVKVTSSFGEEYSEKFIKK